MKEYDLLQSQLGVMLFCISHPDSTYYNLPIIVELSDEIDFNRLAEAWKKLFLLRPVFKTRFDINQNGEFFQYVDDEMEIPIKISNCNDEEFWNYIKNDFVRPFDLFSIEPLIRIELIKTEKGYYQLFDCHHIIADYTLINKVILQEDLSSLYETMNLPLEDYTLQDAVIDEQNSFSSTEYEISENYFLKKFDKTDFITISDYIQNKDYGEMIWSHANIDIGKCDDWCEKYNIKPVMLFQAAFSHTMSLISGNSDFSYWTIYHGRFEEKLQKCYGMHTKNIPVKNVKLENISVIDYIKKSYDEMKLSMKHSNYPFTHFCMELGIKPSLIFNFVAKKDVNYDVILSNHKFQLIHIKRKDCDNVITVQIGFRDSNYEIRVESSNAIINEKKLRLISESMKNVIYNMMKLPDEDISKIPLISFENDKIDEIIELGKGKEIFIEKEDNIISAFRKKVTEQPNSVAVDYCNNKYTYSQIDEFSNIVSSVLKRDANVKKGDVIGVYISRSEKMITYPLGIMKLGAIYLPIDINLPINTISAMCKDASVKAIITDDSADATKIKNICGIILKENDFLDEEIIQNFNPKISHEDCAVILYTSGSTGKPKGIKLLHKGIINYCRWFQDEIKLTPADKFSAHSSFGFDAHIIDIYPALISGASIYIMDENIRKDLNSILSFLWENRISVSFFTTRIANLLIKQNLPLRVLLFGGEKMHPMKIDNDYRLINAYGPTECSIFTTFHDVYGEFNGSIIGKALPNYQLFVVDKNNNLLPPGINGELLIGGAGLSSGYINMNEFNNEKFIDFNPTGNIHLKVYKSGDLVSWENGNLVFKERTDEQIKLRGFRIDFNEIENIASKFQSIVDVVADIKREILCLYYTSSIHISKKDLNDYLALHLPEYMIPSYYMQLRKLPFNTHSKVNRDMLPEPSFESKDYESPKGFFEEKIARAFSKILNVNKIGRNDKFSRLGGDSIAIMRLIILLRENNINIDYKTVIENQSVKKIASKAKYDLSSQKISQNPYVGTIDSTPIIKYFWDLKLANPSYFNQSFLFDCTCSIDIDILKKAMLEVINHHDMLRASVNDEQITIGKPNKKKYFSIEICRSLDYLHETERINRQIDLFNGPLIKLAIFNEDKGDKLYLVIHHIIVDAISWRIIIEDLNSAYAQLLNKNEVSLPIKTDSYNDYSLAIKKFATSSELVEQKNFWDNSIKQIEHGKYTNSPECTMEKIDLKFSKRNYSILMSNCSEYFNVSIDSIFLSVIFKAWKNSFGENNLSIMKENHGRENFDKKLFIDRTVGWFTTYYPIFLKYDEDNIEDIMVYVENILSNIPQKGFGFPILYGSDFKMPLFTFNYLGEMDEIKRNEIFIPVYQKDLSDSIDIKNHYGTDVNMNGYALNDEVFFELMYNSDRFSEKNMMKFKEEFLKILNEILLYADNVYENDICHFSHVHNKKNLFFIHSANYGSEFCYYLAEQIKHDYSFSVIEPYYINHEESKIDSIEELAKKYIGIIKSVQPKGPYYLGGICFGGLIGLEMAIQLTNNGEKVEKLVLMDSHYIKDRNLKDLLLENQISCSSEDLKKEALYVNEDVESIDYYSQLTSKMWLNYKPDYYDGDVLYFKATKRPDNLSFITNQLYDYVLVRKAGGCEDIINNNKLYLVDVPVEHDNILSIKALYYIVPNLKKYINDDEKTN